MMLTTIEEIKKNSREEEIVGAEIDVQHQVETMKDEVLEGIKQLKTKKLQNLMGLELTLYFN